MWIGSAQSMASTRGKVALIALYTLGERSSMRFDRTMGCKQSPQKMYVTSAVRTGCDSSASDHMPLQVVFDGTTCYVAAQIL